MQKIAIDAYAAGLIDGEGSVLLTKQSRHNQFRAPVVSATSTTRPLLEFLVEYYGGHIVPQKKRNDNYLPAWKWSIRYNKALNLLKQIIPYMREPNKVKRTKLLLSMYKKLTVRNGRYTSEQIQAKQQFESLFFSF